MSSKQTQPKRPNKAQKKQTKRAVRRNQIPPQPRAPRKPPVQIPPVVQAREYANALGNRGVAPMVDAGDAQTSSLPAQEFNNVVQVRPQISERSIANVAAAIVMRAIRRGASYAKLDLQQAFYHLYDVMIKSVKGETLDGVSYPSFFWEILTALATKKPGFKQAYAEMTADVVPGNDTGYKNAAAWIYTAGSGGDPSFRISFAVPTDFLQNGFQLLDTTPPSHDPVAGGIAVTQLWTFFKQVTIPFQDYKPLLERDVSAYATLQVDRGRSFDGVGGLRTTTSSEVYNASPILSKFCFEARSGDEQTGPGKRRGFYKFWPQGAGAAYLGARASEFADPRWFHNKVLPLVKDINFFRIFDRFSLMMCRLREVAVKDTTQTNFEDYPLTSQQAAIMLRSVVMRLGYNEGCYDVDNWEEEAAELPLYSLAPGMVSPYSSESSPLLPSFFAENLRGLRRKLISLSKNAPSGQAILDFVPRFCDATGYYLNQQYFWQSEALVPFYVVNAEEALINIIDGATTFNNATRIACLEGKQLETYITLHNNWIKGFSSYCSTLCEVGTEGGANVWQLYASTHQLQVVIPPAPPEVVTPITSPTSVTKVIQKQPSHKNLKSKGYSLKASTIRAVPDSQNIVQSSFQATTDFVCSVTPPAAVWKYIKLMITPERIMQGATAVESDIEFYKSVTLEPAHAKFSTNPNPELVDGVTDGGVGNEYLRALRAIEVDIKQKNAASSEWEEDFKILATKSEGGFIGALAGLVGDAMGIPLIGKGAKMLGL